MTIEGFELLELFFSVGMVGVIWLLLLLLLRG